MLQRFESHLRPVSYTHLDVYKRQTVQDAVTDRSGITGEKMELDGYNVVEGAYTSIYNHQRCV